MWCNLKVLLSVSSLIVEFITKMDDETNWTVMDNNE